MNSPTHAKIQKQTLFCPKYTRPKSFSDTDNEPLFHPNPKRLNTLSSASATSSQANPLRLSQSERSLDDLFQILITIRDNQESMRQSLEQRMKNLGKNFTREIKEKIEKLNNEMTLEFAQADNKIQELETKIKDTCIELNRHEV